METAFKAELRPQEYHQLAEWFHQVAQGNGGITFLAGDWGMGRTTMLRKGSALAEELGLVVVDSWCRGEQGEPAWLPLASLIEQALRHYEDDPQSVPLAEQFHRWMNAPQSWHIPLQFMRLLRPLARKRPLLLCVDDFHLASDNFVRLIQSWLLSIRFEPIGILLTVCTPVERPLLHDLMRQSGEHSVARILELAPLPLEATRCLIKAWSSDIAEDEHLVCALHERTRGCPLFITELLRQTESWIDAWRQQADLSQVLPTSLKGVILQRVSELSVQERDLLNWLSCFESAISTELLPTLLNVSARSMSRRLKSLIESGWLEHLHGESSLLAWRHPLVRETLYNSVPLAKRAQMHRRIVEHLEATYQAQRSQKPERSSIQTQPFVLGDQTTLEEHRWLHWMRSEPDEVVLAHLWEAHQQARFRSNPRLRLELLDACLRAANRVGDQAKRVQLLCERPHLMFWLPDGLPRAVEASQEALAELQIHREYDPDRSLWIQIHCALAGQLAQMGRAGEANVAISNLLEQSDWSSTQRSMLELTLAYLHHCQGNLRDAYQLHKTVWQRMRHDREWWQRWAGVSRYTLQYALDWGDLQMVREVMAQFSQWATQPNAPVGLIQQWHLLQASYAHFEGRGAEQLYHTRSAQSVFNTPNVVREVPEPMEGEISSLYESWFNALLYRDPASALHLAEKSLSMVRQAVSYERETEWLYKRAKALLEMEKGHDAYESIQQAKRLAHRLGNRFLLARCTLLEIELALLSLSDKNNTEVFLMLERSKEFVSTLALPELVGEWYRLHSVALMRAGDVESAAVEARQAVEVAEKWGHALYRGLASLQLADVTEDRLMRECAESLLSGYGAPLWWRRVQRPHSAVEWVSERGWEIELHLLGRAQVCFRGRTIAPNDWVSPRARALFCHLALLQGRPLHSEILCEQHFPHLNPERARVNLQTTISAARRSLRHVLGEEAGEWLRYESGHYRWAPEHTWAIDAYEFERVAREALTLTDSLVQEERLDEALSLYQGDLLPDFAEEAWCLPLHHRFRNLYAECLLARAQVAFLLGDHKRSVEYAERLVQMDTCDEAATRLLMQAYSALGRRADALQVYARCQKALAELLNTTPSEPTRRIYESILKG